MKCYNARDVIIIDREKQIMLIYTEEKSNVPFYTKHGFSVMENGAAIQICNYGNLNEN